MRYFYLLLFLFPSLILSNTFYSKIFIDTTNTKKNEVSQRIFGGFTEFLLDYINGPNGIWSQELMDRGFDINNDTKTNSIFWKQYIKNSNQYTFSLKEGGYNENGLFYQSLNNYDKSGNIGIYQTFVYDDTIEYEIYVYCKSNYSATKAYIKITDTTLDKIFYVYKIDSLLSNWKKEKLILPKFPGISRLNILFEIEGLGQIDIDEASIMPVNNVFGIRKEYFDLFKNWKMGILRYPGGSFADFYSTRWYYGIGPIDKRKTPLYGDRNYKQRMDFGLHEYMKLCDSLKIEPQYTINFYIDSPKEAVEFLRYANSDTNDTFGKLRYLNGSQNPFNIKVIEIGNEQWFYGYKYALNYHKYYDAIYNYDSTLTIGLALDVWPGQGYFDTCMSIIGDKGNLYTYHPLLLSFPKDTLVSDTAIYLNTLALPVNFEVYIEWLNNWLKEKNLHNIYKHGITEWGLGYIGFPELFYDTVSRAASLESGLYYANELITFIRNAESVKLANVTIGFGFIRRGFNSKNGKRSIVPTPAYYSLALLSNHTGNDLINVKINSPAYKVLEINGFWWNNHVKWIDGVATKRDDTIFVAIINKHYSDSAELIFNFKDLNVSKKVKIHQLSSNHFLDQNSFDEPNYIKPHSFQIDFKNIIKVPKHSLNIFEFVLNNDNKQDTLIYDSNLVVNNYIKVYDKYDVVIEENYNEKILNIELIDILGKNNKINYISNNKNYIININDLYSGKYFLIITTEKRKYVHQIIKVN